jgi:hypothetical protein
MSLIVGTAALCCDKCVNTFTVDTWDLDLFESGSEERDMGPEVILRECHNASMSEMRQRN